MIEFATSDNFFVQLNEKYSYVYSIISENSGASCTNVIDAAYIYDTVSIEELLGYNLPKWIHTIYPEPLKLLSGYAFLTYSYSDKFKKLSKYDIN